MRVSLHRRRHESLPPQPARSPKLLLIAVVLGIGTTALAAAGLSGAAPPAFDPAVAAAAVRAEQATRDVVDERVRAHLRSLR